MEDPSEEDARALLGRVLICDDPEEWVDLAMPQGTRRIACGLTSESGEGTGLLAQLDVRKSSSTGIEKFVFSVFRLLPHGRQRIYQLHIERLKGGSRNAHSLPHEHFGKAKIYADKSWIKWSYKAILARFCQQTGVQFSPENPSDPLSFKLTSDKWESR